MANVFLEHGGDDIETAILLENAKQCDLSEISPSYENAVAFTDGEKVFINSDDNLQRILPNYNKDMLKWLLWHERYHMELKHHKRYFTYLEELHTTGSKSGLTKEEVNIIMDILVHDSLARMFPELVETAQSNLAQMRTCNSLKYTFTADTLEGMLDEYKKHKEEEGKSKEDESEDKGTTKSDEPASEPSSEVSKSHKDASGEAEAKIPSKPTPSEDEEEKEDTPSEPEEEEAGKGEHEKVDWSKLNNIDDTEFINKDESDRIERMINSLRRKKFKLARLTQTLNGLATTTKMRTYRVPSHIYAGKGVILKGKQAGKTSLYICFDASGSMGKELDTFKEIISKSIPQAMDVPCEWFAGCRAEIAPYMRDCGEGYYKGTFRDIMPVVATGGYNDDGDRVIELCLKAEEQGYSPIGVTDGGGDIYKPATLKKLKRTILVGQYEPWLNDAKRINPNIQIISL